MRASSLSEPRVLDLLSRYFVPVLYSVDGYRVDNSEADKAEWERIQKAIHGGNINVYIVAPDGKPLDRMNVTQAQDAKNLLPFLQRAIDGQHLEPRKAAAVRASTADLDAPPKRRIEGSKMLRLWSRGERGHAEDWIELPPNHAAQFVPRAGAAVGYTGDLPAATADFLCQHFYSASCNYRPDGGKVDAAYLKATVVGVSTKSVEVVYQGAFRLKHNMTPSEMMPAKVVGHVVGRASFDCKTGEWQSFQLATDKATHTWYWDGKPASNPVHFAVELNHHESHEAHE